MGGSNEDGLAIARQRIAQEREERTGVLDLGQLGLTALPEELFALRHLRALNLGEKWRDDDGEWQEASADIAPNGFDSLARLSVLPDLLLLSVAGCALDSLHSVANLSALQSLDCSSTQVSDLSPLNGLTALQSLDCRSTQVSDLAPLEGLPALQSLDCSGCRLRGFPRWLLDKLEKLVLYDSHIPGVPAAVLSQSGNDNCLAALRAHFADLEAGAATVNDAKLMVLGNGRVGKTQLCRWLRGEPYDDSIPSTHGVLVTSAPLPGGAETRLNIWDFGGQDIYHGTHALFMRTSALFLLAWTPQLENTGTFVVDGIRFRNHPLAYWVDYVRHQAGAGSPVIVVQTRCDQPENDAPCPVPEADLFKAFKFRKIRHFSARKPRGTASLAEALGEAVAWLQEHGNRAVIGAGRYRVQQRLQQMLDADAALPPENRQHRKLTQDAFRQLCDEAGDISSRAHLLSYLHNAGIVFHQKGLFADDIILDQGWALDAIYAVFHRDKSYKRILARQGRFTRADLEDWVWQDHGADEQKLFLSMMQSCGIGFAHRRLGSPGDGEIEYIAPDLLPERAALEHKLVQVWEPDVPTETATFGYPMLHPGLMRSIISTIGSEAGIDAEYWKGGVYVFETETRSRALIEETMLDTWRGEIRVQTQRGQAALLLRRLIKLVEDQQSRAGLTPASVTTTSAVREPVEPVAPLSFAQEPSPMPEWCVSYAWNDTTPEGRDREATVDRLCKEAKARGKTILRDKTALGLGDSLAKFMRRIGRGDRVFVILSDKYLKSAACMLELSEIWRNSRLDSEEFVQRVRLYTLPCARIWSPVDRIGYAIHWKKRYAELEALVKEHGYDILGEKDGQQFRLMKTFYGNVGDILATVADTLQPRTFDDLVKYGFTDADTA
ncbi:MAG: COR domain-containing protein [Rhodospirillales bacterium]